ncbi:MAG: FAD-dependent oxidoreductase, partial [Ignavibacterium sp.]
MKKADKIFDYIIYPANLIGCVTAITKSSEGAEVLLLNNYGFPGGELTHSLCCHQFLDDKIISGKTLEIYNQIVEQKHSIFYRHINQVIINPETVKYVLQYVLEKSKIDLLFHIVPTRIEKSESNNKIILSGKEGQLSFSAKKIIDCSDNFVLMKLSGVDRTLTEANFNLFVSKSGSNGFNIDLSEDEQIVRHKFVKKFIQLFDLRFWVSLNIPIEGEEIFLENKAQKILNEYENFLLTKNARLQLIAPQTYRKYKAETLPYFYENVSHINTLLKEDFT